LLSPAWGEPETVRRRGGRGSPGPVRPQEQRRGDLGPWVVVGVVPVPSLAAGGWAMSALPTLMKVCRPRQTRARGKLYRDLVRDVFVAAFANPVLERLDAAAVLSTSGRCRERPHVEPRPSPPNDEAAPRSGRRAATGGSHHTGDSRGGGGGSLHCRARPGTWCGCTTSEGHRPRRQVLPIQASGGREGGADTGVGRRGPHGTADRRAARRQRTSW